MATERFEEEQAGWGGQAPDPEKLRRDRETVERGFWRKVKRFAAKLPFLDDVVAAYYCAVDPATPLRVKAILFGALAYFVMPIDAIPDFMAWIGFTDDAAVVYAAIRSVSAHITPEHRGRARDSLIRLAEK